MKVQLKFCTIEPTPFGTTTRFSDGAESSNWPHDDVAYGLIVGCTGWGEDRLGYCREHEVCHNLLAEGMFHQPSPIVWRSAHQLPIDEAAAAYEERLVYYFQRYLHGHGFNTMGEMDPVFDHIARRAKEICLELNQ